MTWDLNGNSGTNPATDFVGTTDNQPLIIRTNGAEALRINVGDTSSSAVEVSAQDGLAITGYQPFITLRDANSGNARACIQGVSGDIVLIPDSFIGGGAALVAQTGTGNIGIGTSTPSSRVEIIAQDGLTITGYQPFITLRDANSGNARACVQSVNGDIVLIPDSFIGSGAALVAKTGSGDVIMYGSLSVARDIVLAESEDCAEHFDIAEGEEAAPGAVMVINEDGALASCRKAYDKRVAGVISGAGEFKPGIILGSPDRPNARSPITLMGKVSCQVDAGYGPIEIGDLLTTSETSGHAMKATDATRAFGAVIGKALGSCEDGRGLVPVLVALQ